MARWRARDRTHTAQCEAPEAAQAGAEAGAGTQRRDTISDDPRHLAGARPGKAQLAAQGRSALTGRNTVSFDPSSTLVRPSLRVRVGPRAPRYGRRVSHDDVILVPEFFCAEDDLRVYWRLVDEMRECQRGGDERSEWVSWHEGAHLITQNAAGSATFREVIGRLCEYLSISEASENTRFNWYRNGSDWKPFHHDAAAFAGERANRQNCTVGISFGSERELAFRHARTGELVYFPQTNGMLFFFGRDVNIRWQHGLNALPPEDLHSAGRISIIVFGWCGLAEDEPGSPAPLTQDLRGRTDKQLCHNYQRGVCYLGAGCEYRHADTDAKRWGLALSS